jgi:hypothetical protein
LVVCIFQSSHRKRKINHGKGTSRIQSRSTIIRKKGIKMNLNLMNAASKFRFAYWPDSDAQKRLMDRGNPLVANEQLIRFRMAHGTEMTQNAFDKKDINDEKA